MYAAVKGVATGVWVVPLSYLMSIDITDYEYHHTMLN